MRPSNVLYFAFWLPVLFLSPARYGGFPTMTVMGVFTCSSMRSLFSRKVPRSMTLSSSPNWKVSQRSAPGNGL